MKPFIRSILFLILFSLILNSCSDLSTPTNTKENQQKTKSQQTTNQEGKSTSEFSVKESFNLDIQINGSLKPNEALKIDYNLLSNMDINRAELKVILPHVAAARETERILGNREIIQLPLGKPLAEEFSDRRGFQKGETYSKTIPLTIKEPGYYKIIAIANSLSEERLSEDESMLDNVSRQKKWIWIDPEGGKVIKGFDQSIFPEGVHKVPGPLGSINNPPRLQPVFTDIGEKPKTGMQSSGGSVSMSSSNKTTIVFTYTDPETSTEQPVANTPVFVTIEDEYAGEIVDEYWTETDSQGKIEENCDPSYYESIDAELHTRSSEINVGYEGSTEAGSQKAPLACDYTNNAPANSTQVFVLEKMKEIVNDSRSFFSHSRGRLFLDIDQNDGSFYTSGNDQITILESHTDASPFGNFVLAHEYGHAFHEKGIGGNEGGGNCPSPHFVDGEYNLQCAYSEGFANYHAEALGFDFFEFEGTDYTNGGSSDGAIVEGAVASFLFDITDPANESFDNVDLPGSYVADIIETCEAYFSFLGWIDGNGIDHHVACFENALPDYSSYFPTRSPDPTDYRESATEPSSWNQNEMDQLWKRNLYGEN